MLLTNGLTFENEERQSCTVNVNRQFIKSKHCETECLNEALEDK